MRATLPPAAGLGPTRLLETSRLDYFYGQELIPLLLDAQGAAEEHMRCRLHPVWPLLEHLP